MYIMMNFTGNSYGPAQIKPEFAERVIMNDTSNNFPGIRKMSNGKDKRAKIYQEIMKNPEKIMAVAYNQFINQWDKARKKDRSIADISQNIGVLATLFNLGFDKSKPKANPKKGGSKSASGRKQHHLEHGQKPFLNQHQ